MLLNGIRERTENDAGFFEAIFERGGHRDAVEDGIDGNTCEASALVQRNAEFFVGLEQFGVYLIEALRSIGFSLGRRVVRNTLIIDRIEAHVRPGRFAHGEPVSKGLQAPLGQKRGLSLNA